MAELPSTFGEFGILLGFYVITVGACALLKLSRGAGVVLGLIAYSYLLVIPLALGIVVMDYDFFLKGIAFDSISLDFFPISFWKGWDFSIFLYAFMLIFFLVSAFFFYVRPEQTSNQARQRIKDGADRVSR